MALAIASRAATDSESVARIDPTYGARESSMGQERIANDLLLKLGLQVSPRTVEKYMPRPVLGRLRGGQRWSSLLGNHARAIIACDFWVWAV